MYTQVQIDRFWNNVEVGQPDKCWPWKRSTHGSGYGQVGLKIDGKDRVMKAHKVAWEIHNNERLTPFTRVTHSCDNRLCCNPGHVDADLHHLPNPDLPHGMRGEANGRSKLTERQVRIVKYRLNALTTREIADAFSVAFHTIWDIRKGKTWRHV